MLTWAAYSPDLDNIENAWDVLDRRISQLSLKRTRIQNQPEKQMGQSFLSSPQLLSRQHAQTMPNVHQPKYVTVHTD